MRNKSVFIGLTSLALAGLFLCAVSHTLSAAPAPGPSGYKVIKAVPVGGEGGFWDYVYVDSEARRVYVSHGTHTVVMDADKYTVVGDIPTRKASTASPSPAILGVASPATAARMT